MKPTIMKHNPAFLSDEDLAAGFVVRLQDLEILLRAVRENTEGSNQHLLVVGPRGMGKTTLVRRLASAVRADPELGARWYPLVYPEESYQVGTVGELWLEALLHLADQTGDDRWRRIHQDLKDEPDDERLRHRALAHLLDHADEQGRRLLLVVENLQMILGEQLSEREGWTLRHTLQNEPRLMLVATAPMLFDEVSHRKRAFYDLLHVHTLDPLHLDEIRTLWRTIAGSDLPGMQARPLEILTGGNARLLVILATFAAGRSFRALMDDLVLLVDEHTNYFKANVEALPPKERRVFLALADLWEPALARQVAREARVEVSEASALLHRLEQRGAVSVLPQRKGRGKLYQLTERLYNLYHLMRRRGGAPSRVRAAVEFMVAYYEADRLAHRVAGLAGEACALTPGERGDHLVAYAEVLRRTAPEVQRAALAQTEAGFFALPDLPEEVRELRVRLVEEPAERLVDQAGERIEHGDYIGAEQAAREAIQILPGYARGWNSLGVALERLGNLPSAESAYREAMTHASNVSLYWANLGCILLYADHPSEAEAVLRRATTLDPTDGHAWNNLGVALERLGLRTEAEAAYREATTRPPGVAQHFQNLGHMLLDAGRPTEAEAALRRATELNPTDAWAWNALGVALERIGSRKEAEAAVRVATTHDPRVALYWRNLGDILLDSDRNDEAEIALRRTTQLDPVDGWAWNNLGLALERLGKLTEAEAAYREALTRDPGLVAVTHTLATVLGTMGRWEEALAVLPRYLDDPLCVDSYLDDTNAFFISAIAAGQAAAALPVLARAAQAPRLEPLLVALRLAAGEDVLAPPEILEVARDILDRAKPTQGKTP